MLLFVLVLSCLGLAVDSVPAAGKCICFTANAVNIRSTACGSTIRGQGNNGNCFVSKGESSFCSLSGSWYTFWHFEYAGGSGWSANTYLTTGSDSSCASGGSGTCSNVEVISRSMWGARAPRSTTNLSTPVSKAYVHHTAGAHCYTRSTCDAQVRGIQNYHMDSNGWSDIGYSFLVGEDGRAYEGRGWNVQGAHTSGQNSVSQGISVMGTFTSSLPNTAGLNALTNIMACARDQNKLTSGHTVSGHRDASGASTACPGNSLYGWVQGLPNYTSNP